MSWKRCSVHIMLAASLAANAWLGRDVLRLRTVLAGLTARHILPVGTVVEVPALATRDGRRITMSYDDFAGPTVFYILSPACKWCERNVDSVNSLSARLRDRARFVTISLSGPGVSGAFPTWPTPSPAYTGDSDRIGRQLRIRSTPTTIVVSNRGVVLAVWEGAYGGAIKSQIERHFGVELPPMRGEEPGNEPET